MGVKGLQSFLERVVPGGCTELNIQERADAHRAHCPQGTRPTIVVDGLSLIRWIYSCATDYIFGGPWNDLCTAVKHFVQQFENAGISLVFIFDGCIPKVKMTEWVMRRALRVKEVAEMYQKLHSGTWSPDYNNAYQCPSGTGYTFSFAVKFLTLCKVIRSVEDCDIEVARYAETHAECFAVLTQDSDFAIFNLHVTYLSVLHLNLECMTTRAYHGDALANHLGLDRKVLPLFACLAGNDSVNREMHLARFHGSLGYPVHQRFHLNACYKKLADVIRKEGWSLNLEPKVARKTGVPLHVLQHGISEYDLQQPPLCLRPPPEIDPESWCTAVKCYKDLSVFPGLLQILYGKELFLSETTEELLGPHIPPAYSCFRPIRRRVYWVLFGGRQSVEIIEHTAYPFDIGVRHERVSPTPFIPREAIPTLHELWSGQDNLQHVKWQLFYGCLGVRFSLADLAAIPARFVHLCCAVNIMLAARVVEQWEAMAFLVQAMVPPHISSQCSQVKIERCRIHPRIVSLATYFMMGVQAVTTALSACGHPLPLEQALPWLYFDGKVFHVLYQELEAGRSVDSIFENNVQCLEVFYRLWRITSM
ncbi:constitutive coactivator of peroxisome proliferator-activated receptor gamma-like isoform X1 [Ornithodoros turicata]|uniref:constitutive coactivator of peroxisome proliferator-activated receptor gamma-like isoform X1 n=1 Tax=Ornithodoros turicata TaxID=34597 RepID=UPI0031392864